ncbi:hypothetical protein SOVF_206600 [Spinacia oleracea]|uniref:BSD domain-containing protein n=1 Tax=Spinacia oleracea TaxID=3562 RepID=A0A9R0I181_SPIOL|nr:uncharacterized protein LOC110779420 [Spinacia oleracea]KNA03690.1 hypothetical protein SOVF_206600 [Spinacia oleracea]
MNFFKSVFADDDPEPDPQSPTSNPQSPNPESQSPQSENHPATPTWGFVGGLIKTFATKSESVIETYRRDLQEFSSGLKMETQVFKEVASSSLEVGASKAQESLESVGQAIDNIGSVVWKSTAQIISQGSDSDQESQDLSLHSSSNTKLDLTDGRKYSRFDAQLRGIQCDINTYVEEFEDEGEFEKWRLSFDLGEKGEEMENLMRENGVMEGIYKRVVPSVVDDELFWFRYYYRVHKLEQAESVRAKLVERANEDEELSWDVDDEDEDEDEDEKEEEEEQEQEEEKEKPGAGLVDESSQVSPDKEAKSGGDEEVEKKEKNVDEKTPSEGSKDSDITVVSSQPARGEDEDDDLGWDEIEDIGSDNDGDEKKGKQSSPSNKEELRKRLSVAEDDDEDLSWDIEDDDEPIKKS